MKPLKLLGVAASLFQSYQPPAIESEVIRTPDERFANLPGWPFAPRYVEVGGLRMHYIDEGRGETVLCLHGEPSWSYLYRKIAARLLPGCRVVAPDFIGFGRSDKYTRRERYTFALHRDALRGFIEALGLRDVTLVVQDWGGLIGLRVASLVPERIARLVIMNTGLPVGVENPLFNFSFGLWQRFAGQSPKFTAGAVVQMATVEPLPPAVVAAYDAPFPDERYLAGARQWPSLVPVHPDNPAVPDMQAAREALRRWQKPALVLFSDRDPITRHYAAVFRHMVPSAAASPEITIRRAGHFLQEDRGEEIGDRIGEFMQK